MLARFIKHLNNTGKYLIAFISGASAGLAFAPYFYFFILFFSFSLLLALLEHSPGKKQSFLVGWFFGFGHFIVGVYWLYHPMMLDLDQYAILIPFAILGMPAVLALYIGTVTFLTNLIPANNAAKVVIFSCFWVIIEYLRAHLFTGFPWNLLGYSLAFNSEISQLASIGGIYALSFLILLIASIPYLIYNNNYKIHATLVILTITSCYYYGYSRIKLPPTNSDVAIRIVQANIKQTLKFTQQQEVANIYHQIEMSNSPSLLPIKYVIWPEGAFAFDIDYPGLLHIIKKAAPIKGALITGGDRIERNNAGFKWWNSLQMISNDGKIIASYDKVHLVPFGEYVPFRNILPINKIVAGLTDCSPGKSAHNISVIKEEEFRPLICYESIFADEISVAGQSPKWLLNITNDGWYGQSSGPYQHFAMSRFRAIEQGVPLVRSAKTGISAIVDSYGRVVTKADLNTQGVVDGYLPSPAATTFYSLYGDTPIMALIILILASFLYRQKYL
jgi:apolipoprotein N-acyltransferase